MLNVIVYWNPTVLWGRGLFHQGWLRPVHLFSVLTGIPLRWRECFSFCLRGHFSSRISFLPGPPRLYIVPHVSCWNTHAHSYPSYPSLSLHWCMESSVTQQMPTWLRGALLYHVNPPSGFSSGGQGGAVSLPGGEGALWFNQWQLSGHVVPTRNKLNSGGAAMNTCQDVHEVWGAHRDKGLCVSAGKPCSVKHSHTCLDQYDTSGKKGFTNEGSVGRKMISNDSIPWRTITF